jgi:hypothetical protein
MERLAGGWGATLSWGFPDGYGAISWGLSGTCLGPVWGFPAGYGGFSWGLSGTCLGFPRLLLCDQVGHVWDLSGTCLGPVWGFPPGYGAISWGLSPNPGRIANSANGFLQFIISVYFKY